MSEPSNFGPRRARLRRTSAIMRWVSLLMAALGPIVLIPVWIRFEYFAPSVMPGLPAGDLSVLDRVGGYAISMLPTVIAVWGFLQLARLFGRFASGDLFDAGNAIRLRRFAIALIGVVPAKVISGALTSVWLTREAAPGFRQLQIAFSSDDVMLLVIGLLLAALATVLREAAEIADDYRQFV